MLSRLLSHIFSRRKKKRPKPPGRWRIARAQRVIIGAGLSAQDGWLATDRGLLDVTDRASFARYWSPGSRVAFFAEHVWEHLTEAQARAAIANCFEFLRPGGTLRLAVPDGMNPDPAYREHVRPGGTGPGADDHKILFDHRSLGALLASAGFQVERLEYWDEGGRFHHTDWTSDCGHIQRSRRYDRRNQNGVLGYTSLILDGIKPAGSNA